jgi:hypothetical protein
MKNYYLENCADDFVSRNGGNNFGLVLTSLKSSPAHLQEMNFEMLLGGSRGRFAPHVSIVTGEELAWVTSYEVYYRHTVTNKWTLLAATSGNSDAFSEVVFDLSPYFNARNGLLAQYIRIRPTGHHLFPRMRVAIYGIDAVVAETPVHVPAPAPELSHIDAGAGAGAGAAVISSFRGVHCPRSLGASSVGGGGGGNNHRNKGTKANKSKCGGLLCSDSDCNNSIFEDENRVDGWEAAGAKVDLSNCLEYVLEHSTSLHALRYCRDYAAVRSWKKSEMWYDFDSKHIRKSRVVNNIKDQVADRCHAY